MISCTEFIPAYSELFTYLDDHYGKAEVDRFWTYLFEPTGKGIPLINFARAKGVRGCWEYWEGTLTEEAADLVHYMNEEQGWIFGKMRYCPSKGRLLELEKEIGLKPYYNYCGHCDYYRAALNEVGLDWIRDHTEVDQAKCSSLIFDPKKFKGMIELTDEVEVMDLKSTDFEYFHPDFHSSLNMGIHYIAREHGVDALVDHLTIYTKHVYIKTIEAMKNGALDAIADRIKETYRLEKAEDALELHRDGNTLSVKIAYCPAVKHLRKTGREVTPWFRYTTETVMQTLADIGGLKFTMESYDEQTGAAAYSFVQE